MDSIAALLALVALQIDSDHRGAVIGKHHARERRRSDPGQLDDADSVQRPHKAVMEGPERAGKWFGNRCAAARRAP